MCTLVGNFQKNETEAHPASRVYHGYDLWMTTIIATEQKSCRRFIVSHPQSKTFVYIFDSDLAREVQAPTNTSGLETHGCEDRNRNDCSRVCHSRTPSTHPLVCCFRETASCSFNTITRFTPAMLIRSFLLPGRSALCSLSLARSLTETTQITLNGCPLFGKFAT
jgi:hypothetical protein